MTAEGARAVDVRRGAAIEVFTVAWMAVEAVVAIAAGILAHSVLLTAFGIDSAIELVSGSALLWRLRTEAQGGSLERVERAENRAAWVAGVGLALLCVYITVTSGLSLWTHNQPNRSLAGVAVAVAALIVMPVLVVKKREIAAKIDSSALRADAACSLTCAYMAATLLAGLILTALLGWWWADALAALALLYWILPAAREAIANARAGRSGCACGQDAHQRS